MKLFIKAVLEKLLSAKIYRKLPRGIDQFQDVQAAFPHLQIRTILDIGANIGQSATKFTETFPGAKVYCVEPSAETFQILKNNVSSAANVEAFHYAMSDTAGSGTLALPENPVLRRLVTDPTDPDQMAQTEEVTLITLDDFCAQQNISDVDYLKVDTEGHEIAVLKGSAKMLETGQIKLIELELGMNPDNTYHTKFEDAKALLESYGYRLLTICEQFPERRTNQPHLRRVNAVFASAHMIAV